MKFGTLLHRSLEDIELLNNEVMHRLRELWSSRHLSSAGLFMCTGTSL